ncbi:MAG: flippase-like domain-containing protein, partial [Bdellovibrionales bacterium]|nr:flippase-like domain-containing protein [Bdellovibrionales bacterium]
MTPTERAKKIHWLRNTALGLAVSIAAFWWILRDIQIEDVLRKVGAADASYLLLAVAATFASYTLRSWRWPYFFKHSPPGFADSFRCLILGFFMNNTLPARLGELIRAHLGGRATGQSRTLVLATIAAERLIDGLTISVIFATLFTLGRSASAVEEGRVILYVAYGFAGVSVATLAFLSLRERFYKLLARMRDTFPGHLSNFTLVRIERFIEGLEPMMHPRPMAVIAPSSAVIWLIELAVYFFVARGFEQDLSVAQLALFLAAVNFSSL